MIKLLAILGTLMLIAWIFKQPTIKGKCGELIVALCLKFGLDAKVYRILNNVMIPDIDGGTTQIDHIVLSPFGLFVIETKNMKGWIFGDKNSDKWVQQIFKCRNQFQNPFRQNYKHISCLAELTGFSQDAFTHIIVFVGDCHIKTRDRLPESLVTGGCVLIRFIHSHSEKKFSHDMLDTLQNRILKGLIDNSRENKRTHVEHVKELIATKNVQADPTCPQCRSSMIRRRAKVGVNTGKYFWGCSKYPKCHGIVNE